LPAERDTATEVLMMTTTSAGWSAGVVLMGYLPFLVCARADAATLLERALDRPSRMMALAFLATALLVWALFDTGRSSFLPRLRSRSDASPHSPTRTHTTVVLLALIAL